ncbi:amidohydrolase family protein [Paraburkholderia acidisoli]|uniref:Amidohydrolase family protein n=1 Tax=Paraburkholderia acidisoli TaxID=2571748 RepID=A0A7Z2JI75_9BURK|nr:amidohydrolase family protein [Paraburkholderia acidisoli]
MRAPDHLETATVNHDENTTLRRPAFALPRGACDTHCHVLGPVDRFPYAQARHYTPHDSDKQVLSAMHARLGVERTVIVQATVYGTDNRIVLDAIADDPQARRGVALIDDTTTDAELEALHAGGMRAARFGFVPRLWTPPEPATLLRLAARIAPLGWHLLLHLDATSLDALQPTLDALPVPFVIDHMGRIDVALGVRQAGFVQLREWARREHCWVKVSALDRLSAMGAPFIDTAPYVRALLDIAPGRVLWGTDFPHPNPRHLVHDDADLVDVLPLCGDTQALHRLLVANPARLYGFD